MQSLWKLRIVMCILFFSQKERGVGERKDSFPNKRFFRLCAITCANYDEVRMKENISGTCEILVDFIDEMCWYYNMFRTYDNFKILEFRSVF